MPPAGRLLASATPRRPISPLGDSLTVELPALDRTAQVRILVPQPSPRTLDGPATGPGLIVGSIWDLFDRICSRNVHGYGKPPENAISTPEVPRVSAMAFSYTENSSFPYTIPDGQSRPDRSRLVRMRAGTGR